MHSFYCCAIQGAVVVECNGLCMVTSACDFAEAVAPSHWSTWGAQALKGALDKCNIIPQLFPKKVGILIPSEVLACTMIARRVLQSTLIYFGRNVNISSIFYFSKSTSINTQHSSLLDTQKMMLFTKYLIKWKRIGRISWKFQYWFDLNSSIELPYYL